MDNKTYSIGILSMTAVVLLVANFMATPPAAHATQGFGVMGQDYQVVSAPEQSGGDALYVLNNRTGMLAVFTYEAAARQMVPRVVTPITAAFPTAGATGDDDRQQRVDAAAAVIEPGAGRKGLWLLAGRGSRAGRDGGFVHARIAQLAGKVLGGTLLNRDEAEFLTTVGGEDVYDLFYWANKVRVAFKGKDVKFCAIIAAKAGGCSEDCKFCAQSEHHEAASKDQSKLTDDQVLESAWHAAEVGADSFGIVNSGRGPTRRELEDWLKPLMSKIAKEGKTRACATLGALTPETAKFLYDCGIRRINHNIETSERHYPNIVSTHPFSERINTLKVAKAAGLSLCSGGIFGMGEEWGDRLDMMFTLREIGVDVMPINFLNAIHGTPLADMPQLHPMECLKIIAICRLVLPTAELKVAGGREKVLRDLQSWIFFAGADSTMIGNYLTTYGRKPEMDHQMVHDLGLKWRAYDGGGVEANGDPMLGAVSHTGKHRIPILYEREVLAAPPVLA